MTTYLQLNGSSSYIKTNNPITFDEVIMDFKSRQTNGDYYIDARTGAASAYVYYTGGLSTSSGSAPWSNGIYIDNVLYNGGTITDLRIPLDTRVTMRLVNNSGTNSVDDIVFFANNTSTATTSMMADVFSIKLLLDGVVVAHYDMSTGTVNDQSGNGNHATLTGGTWINSVGDVTGSDVTPNMTGYNAPSPYVVQYSSNHANGPAWRAFNGTATDSNDRWLVSPYSSAAPEWISFDFGSGNEKIIQKYAIRNMNYDYQSYAKNGSPSTWKLQGSNDHSTWTDLDSRTSVVWTTYNQKQEFIFTNSNAYRYYRLYITDNFGVDGDALSISELEMMTAFDTGYKEDLAADFSTGTLTSVSANNNNLELSKNITYVPSMASGTFMSTNITGTGASGSEYAYQVTVGASNLIVSKLKNNAPGKVNIWDTTNSSLVAQANLSAAGEMAITPITLIAGRSYRIGYTTVDRTSANGGGYVNNVVPAAGFTSAISYWRTSTIGAGTVYPTTSTTVVYQRPELIYEVATYATSGNRVSPAYDLSTVDKTQSSIISWNTTTPANTTLTVQTSVDSGTSWQNATNGGAIPNLSTANDSLLIKELLTTTNTAVTPQLHDLSIGMTEAIVAQDITLTDLVIVSSTSSETLGIHVYRSASTELSFSDSVQTIADLHVSSTSLITIDSNSSSVRYFNASSNSNFELSSSNSVVFTPGSNDREFVDSITIDVMTVENNVRDKNIDDSIIVNSNVTSLMSLAVQLLDSVTVNVVALSTETFIPYVPSIIILSDNVTISTNATSEELLIRVKTEHYATTISISSNENRSVSVNDKQTINGIVRTDRIDSVFETVYIETTQGDFSSGTLDNVIAAPTGELVLTNDSAPIHVTLTEDFNGSGGNSYFNTIGFNKVNRGSSSFFSFLNSGTLAPYEGLNSWGIGKSYTFQSGTWETNTIINIPADATNATFSFYCNMNAANNGIITIYDGGTGSGGTLIATYNTSTVGWENKVYNLTPGKHTIRFVYSTSGTSNIGYFAMDMFKVEYDVPNTRRTINENFNDFTLTVPFTSSGWTVNTTADNAYSGSGTYKFTGTTTFSSANATITIPSDATNAAFNFRPYLLFSAGERLDVKVNSSTKASYTSNKTIWDVETISLTPGTHTISFVPVKGASTTANSYDMRIDDFNIVYDQPTNNYVSTGNRVSSSIDLTNIVNYTIDWNENVPASTSIALQASTDGGSNWSNLTKGQNFVNNSGATALLIKEILTTSDSSKTPSLQDMTITGVREIPYIDGNQIFSDVDVVNITVSEQSNFVVSRSFEDIAYITTDVYDTASITADTVFSDSVTFSVIVSDDKFKIHSDSDAINISVSVNEGIVKSTNLQDVVDLNVNASEQLVTAANTVLSDTVVVNSLASIKYEFIKNDSLTIGLSISEQSYIVRQKTLEDVVIVSTSANSSLDSQSSTSKIETVEVIASVSNSSEFTIVQKAIVNVLVSEISAAKGTQEFTDNVIINPLASESLSKAVIKEESDVIELSISDELQTKRVEIKSDAVIALINVNAPLEASSESGRMDSGVVISRAIDSITYSKVFEESVAVTKSTSENTQLKKISTLSDSVIVSKGTNSIREVVSNQKSIASVQVKEQRAAINNESVQILTGTTSSISIMLKDTVAIGLSCNDSNIGNGIFESGVQFNIQTTTGLEHTLKDSVEFITNVDDSFLFEAIFDSIAIVDVIVHDFYATSRDKHIFTRMEITENTTRLEVKESSSRLEVIENNTYMSVMTD